MSSGRILVIRGGAIGDFIVTLPVLAALRRQFPGVRLELVGYPGVAALALDCGWVDAVHPIEARPLAGFFARKGVLDPKWSGYFAEFHVILSYLFDPDEIFRTNLARVTKAQVIQGPHRPDDSNPAHATEQLMEPLQKLAIFDADPVPSLNLKTAANRTVFPRWIAVHPGAGGAHKIWPRERWRDLLGRVLETQPVRLLLVGGEAELEILDLLSRQLPADRIETAVAWPLPRLAARLSECSGFLGHDSGIAHLAAACGLPGMVLWGPTQSRVWRPRSPRVELVMAPGGNLAELTTDEVAGRTAASIAAWINEPPSGPPGAA
jgi:hypothetical protein